MMIWLLSGSKINAIWHTSVGNGSTANPTPFSRRLAIVPSKSSTSNATAGP